MKGDEKNGAVLLPRMEEDFFRSLEAEDLRLLNGYDEARAPKRPGATLDDVNEIIKDYNTALDVEIRLKALNYFNWVIARHGTIEARKKFDYEKRDKSVFGQDWWEQGFKEIDLDLSIENSGSRGSRAYTDKVLRIGIMVYGKASPKELAKRGEGNYFSTHYYHRKKSVFDGKAIPLTWPGPVLLPSSLDPEVRKKASEICAEAYKKFLHGLVPPAPDVEDMHTMRGYDEGKFFTTEELVAEAERLITVADLEKGMKVRMGKKFDYAPITITSISPMGKAFAVDYRFDKSGEHGYYVMDPKLGYDWTVVKSPEIETMHTMRGYDEAKKKLPTGTFDVTEILQNNEKIKETEDRLTGSNAFDRAFTRPRPSWRPGINPHDEKWGEITATKTYTDPKKEFFLNARLYLRLSRRASILPVLHIETDVYTTYDPDERIKRGRTWGHQTAKKDFPITAIPRVWPGGSNVLNPSLNDWTRQKVNLLFAETYKAFVNALVPPPPEIEDMHLMRGYDEAKRAYADLSSLTYDDFLDLSPRIEKITGKNPHTAVPDRVYIYTQGKKLLLQFCLTFGRNAKPTQIGKALIKFFVEVYRDEDGFAVTRATYAPDKVPMLFPLVKNMGDEYETFRSLYNAILQILTHPTPEIDTMHTMRGYDENVTRSFTESFSIEQIREIADAWQAKGRKYTCNFDVGYMDFEKLSAGVDYYLDWVVDKQKAHLGLIVENPDDPYKQLIVVHGFPTSLDFSEVEAEIEEEYRRFIPELQILWREFRDLVKPPDVEDMHLMRGYDEALIVRLEKANADSEPFSMWSNTDKYVPVASEEDRELLYGVEESKAAVEVFLSIGKLMEEVLKK